MHPKLKKEPHTLKLPGDPNVMTVTQVAEYFGISTQTVYYLAEANKLPGKKIGRVWRFHKPTLEDFLTQKLPEKGPSVNASANNPRPD